MSSNNGNISVKSWGMLALGAVIVLFIINALFGGAMNYGYGMYNGGIGLGFNGIIASVLVLLVKLLWFVLVVSLVIGIVVVLKNNVTDVKKFKLDFIGRIMDSGNACQCGTKISPEFKFCPNCKIGLNNTCIKCGREIKVGWKCCPACGNGTEQ